MSTDTMAAGLRALQGRAPAAAASGHGVAGVAVYDDFAHHPTAIAETLPGRAIGVSRPPHLGDLRAAVGDLMPPRVSSGFREGPRRGPIDVVLPAVFRSTLPEDERLSTEALVADLKAAGVDARYIPDTADIVRDRRRGRAAG